MFNATCPDHCCASTIVICPAVHFYLGESRFQTTKRFLVLQSPRCVGATKDNKGDCNLHNVHRASFQASGFGDGKTLRSYTSQFLYDHKLQKLQESGDLIISGIQLQEEVLPVVHTNYQVVQWFIGLGLMIFMDLTREFSGHCVT